MRRKREILEEKEPEHVGARTVHIQSTQTLTHIRTRESLIHKKGITVPILTTQRIIHPVRRCSVPYNVRGTKHNPIHMNIHRKFRIHLSEKNRKLIGKL